MKDVFDMVTDVRSLINVPAVVSLIDGKVYPNIRPDGSEKADIVVSGLGITNTQDQIGAGNINIYVPQIVSGGMQVTDQARLSSLSKVVSSMVKCVYKPSFRVFLEDEPIPIRDADGKYLVTIRYKYYSLQNEQVEV